MKRCSKCQRTLPLESFHRREKGRRRADCRECYTARKRARYDDLGGLSSLHRFYRARKGASRRGIAWELTFDEWEALDGTPCHYCGKEFSVRAGSGIDRVNNLEGYTRANSTRCCPTCNIIKGSTFTEDQMLQIGRLIATFTIEPMWRNA